MVKLEMNERIKELAFKAAGGMLSYDGEDEWRLSQKEAEKFAELIVRECADIFEGVYTDQQRPERIDTRIKQHFGVEE